MAEELIITKTDILEFWPQMDVNISDQKINSYIRRSQQSDLKPALGAPLYFDVVSNPEAPDNVTLIDGTEYTYQGNVIFFEGIRPFLCAMTYSRIMLNINVSVGRASVIDKATEESTPHTIALIKQRSRETESEGLRLQAELRQFLDQNRTIYPLYGQRLDASADRKTSFRISKVSRHQQQ